MLHRRGSRNQALRALVRDPGSVLGRVGFDPGRRCLHQDGVDQRAVDLGWSAGSLAARSVLAAEAHKAVVAELLAAAALAGADQLALSAAIEAPADAGLRDADAADEVALVGDEAAFGGHVVTVAAAVVFAEVACAWAVLGVHPWRIDSGRVGLGRLLRRE